MKTAEVRQKYLEFMKERGHVVVPGASLVSENDSTTLFTGSGMQPMISYLLGVEHPAGTRVADSQRCFRAEDIEEVGDNRHTTFFEMLGNWSFGDADATNGVGYFRKEQITWMHEFLTKEIGIDANRLWVTCFEGDEKFNLPRDTESAEIWKKLGIPNERILFYPSRKNWWSRSGPPEKMPVGEPGGPDTEMFYDFSAQGAAPAEFGGQGSASGGGGGYDFHANSLYSKEKCHPNCDCGRFVEIGNNVFMTYKKIEESKFEFLPRKNVDFGGGLERITAAANNEPDVFKLDIFGDMKTKLESLSGKAYGVDGRQRSFRIVLDHTRAARELIKDGVRPSNTEHGYVLRRLLRRAILHADKLGITPGALFEGEVEKEEEIKFRKTLNKGLHEFEKGERDAFVLFTTYGFPFEFTQELANEEGEKINEGEFKKKMQEHSQLSRIGSEQKFKGGLADHSDMSVKYHTATHLLHKALREVLGEHVCQKGSNITPERLRFDFSYSNKMAGDEIKRVEDLVNAKISEALLVTYEDLPLEEAQKIGAIGLFEDKYEDKVRVYKIGDFSLEFCGGPHVSNTNKLALGASGAKLKFVIKKEEAVSVGVRRIKAVLQ